MADEQINQVNQADHKTASAKTDAIESDASSTTDRPETPTRGLRNWHALLASPRGATMLEWTLLLAFIGVPAYGITRLLLKNLTSMYQMMTTMNGLPFP